jgi:signal transduction histidine kinase
LRRRLLALTAFTSSLVLAVLAIAVLPLVESRVTEQLDQRMHDQILSIAGYVLHENPDDAQVAAYLTRIDDVPGTTIGVESPNAAPLGKGGPGVLQRWPGNWPHRGARTPRSVLGFLYPRFYYTTDGDQIASQGVFTGSAMWIVEGTITHGLISREERQHWILIGGFSAAALAIALAGADLLARRITKPISAAVRSAESIGRGRLDTPVPTTGPREVIDLGIALNQLSARIDRLLASERQRAADLSHRLRTPLTVLALETQRLEPELADRPEQLQRVQNSIAELERGLDDVIRESRRTREDGLVEQSDAAEVLRNHIAYWSPLAQAQSRTVHLDLGPGPALVPLSAKQLGVALDALISNIFRHTAPGTGYSAVLRRGAEGVTIRLHDTGSHRRTTETPSLGSTGIGLNVARSTIEAVGGTLTTDTGDDQGMTVTMQLKLAANTPEKSIGGTP